MTRIQPRPAQHGAGPHGPALSLKSMKYLIIPDVHNRVEWAENLIALHPDHQPVFLGDYFDSFNDTPAIARHTAEWLRFSIGKGRIHLLGNHDLPHRWQSAPTMCPGWTREKARAILEHVREDQWKETRLALILERLDMRPLVLSHAGFTLANLYGVADFRDVAANGRCAHLRNRLPSEHLDEIRKQWVNCVSAAAGGGDHFWLNQGSRMGRRDVAGPFWIDRHDLHSQLPGIDQIVGHTHVHTPQRHCVPHAQNPESVVWFVDGHGKFAATVDFSQPSTLGGMTVNVIHALGDKAGAIWTP